MYCTLFVRITHCILCSLGLPDSSLGTRLSLPDGPSRLDDGGEDPVVNFHGLNGGLQVKLTMICFSSGLTTSDESTIQKFVQSAIIKIELLGY